MNQNKTHNENRLAAFRRRMGYSQRRAAHLLGHRSHAALSQYEQGIVLPALATALRLEIILRTPVAFLFPKLYEELRRQIRAEEEKLAGFGQQSLFDHDSLKLL
jgi:transcriptional regulator with XRE-family HTH domain